MPHSVRNNKGSKTGFGKYDSSLACVIKKICPELHSIKYTTTLLLAFQIFHGGNSTFINSFDKTKFLTLLRVTKGPLALHVTFTITSGEKNTENKGHKVSS